MQSSSSFDFTIYARIIVLSGKIGKGKEERKGREEGDRNLRLARDERREIVKTNPSKRMSNCHYNSAHLTFYLNRFPSI